MGGFLGQLLQSSSTSHALGFLDYQRETLWRKCRGLSDEQLPATLPPSPITLGGLLKHLTCVEDSWFTEASRSGGF